MGFDPARGLEGERLAAVLDAAEMGVWSLDAVTGEFVADAVARRLWGAGAGPLDLAHIAPDAQQRDALRRAVERTLATGAPLRAELRTADAARRLTMIGRLVRDAAGRPVAIDGVVHAVPPAPEEDWRRLAVEAARIGVWEMDPATGEVRWDARCQEIWGLPGDVRSREQILALAPAEDRALLDEALRQALDAARDGVYDVEHRIVRPDGRLRWLVIRGQSLFAGDGAARRPVRMIGIAMDVTARRRDEESRELVLRELTHRVKNLIAVVQSIADLSGRAAPEAAGFLQGFRGRLAALAAAHNLLLGRDWHGARLPVLVQAVLEPFIDRNGGRIRLDIEDVPLSPHEAQTLALLLHELATNALKYGALSLETGQVTLTAARERGTEAEARLVLEWRETGGPALPGPPQRRGFGLLMLERALRHQHAGETVFAWRPDGLVCRLILRLSNPD